ncbi:MAG: T9SS type A sorting domain-containing protein [Bacteroidia bacterium]
MKKITLFFFLLIACNAFAQVNSIPNGEFESWTNLNWMDPVNWWSLNDTYGPNGQGNYTNTVIRSTDAYHGKYAAQLESINFGPDTIPGMIGLGIVGGSPVGIPISEAPTGIRLYYTYSRTAPDSAAIEVEFKKAGSVIGIYLYKISNTTNSYLLFSQMFSPALSQTPDTVLFTAFSTTRLFYSKGFKNAIGWCWAPGSTFQIDSLSFTGLASQPAGLNGDFEQWNADTNWIGPVDWNEQEGFSLARTTDAVSGFAAELGTTLTSCTSCVGPQFTKIRTGNEGGSGDNGGYPYTNTIDTLEFYYKYAPSSGNPLDSGAVSLDFHNSTANNQYYIITLGASAVYKKVDYPISISGFTPDSVAVGIQSSYCNSCSSLPMGDTGSVIKVDNIHFKSQQHLSVSPAVASICAGTGGVTLVADGETSYTWAPATGLSCTNCSDPVANPLSTTTYTVTGTTGTSHSIVNVTVTIKQSSVKIPRDTSVSCGKSLQLNAVCNPLSPTSVVWSPSTYLSSTSIVNPICTPTSTVTYTLTVDLNNGCVVTDTVTVQNNPLASICIVTVDTGSDHNIIVWDNTGLAHIDSFKIYYQNSASLWQLIKAVPFSAPNYIIDSTPINDPNANTVRYCLTAKDSCGGEEPISSSSWQNTPFIIGNGSGTFSWGGTAYLVEGSAQPVRTYRLFRDTLRNGHWQAIDSVAGNQYQMTDPNYAMYPKARYRVDGELFNGGCPYNGDLRPYAINNTTTRSNTQHNTIIGAVKQIVNPADAISVYPNPAGQTLNIKFSYAKAEDARISIVDVTGREVYSELSMVNGELSMNIANLSTGIYFVRVVTNTSSQVVKFVKL